MENYEGIFIIKPEIKDEDVKNVFKAISDSVTKHGGTVKKEEPWGRRALAYPVKKAKEGHYLKLDFSAPTDAVAKLEEAYRLNDDILRTMITRR
ncbi:MAG: 30S ribosomal protein S6 [Candidatus Omnitrophota bacterium]|nr:30S ribosomal protein S6 [Candidatus Omnitrophota bacterium]